MRACSPWVTFVDALELLEAGSEPKALVMIGDSGGNLEDRGRVHPVEHDEAPVSVIAGQIAPVRYRARPSRAPDSIAPSI